MRKLWTIAWKEISTRFTDRNLLLIMIAAPLAIATIVGLAFGGLGGSESPVEHIRVAVVNLDAGGGQSQRFGDILTSLLVSGELPASEGATLTQCPGEEQPTNASQAGGTSLDTLIDGTAFGTAEAVALIVAGTIDSPSAYPGSPEFLEQAARSAVDHGQYAALVIIPRTFSASLAALMDPTRDQPQVEVAVYGNRGEALASGIVGSVVDGLTAQMTSGSIAIGAMIGEVMSWRPEALARLPQAGLDELYACAFLPGSDVVSLDRQTIEPAGENNAAGGILVAAGSAQAMFFALFTGQFGILSMHEERKNWTLQRLVASPTPAWSILGGKLVGVMASILFQLTALAAALTLVGSLMSGRLAMIWGSHLGSWRPRSWPFRLRSADWACCWRAY